MKAVNTEPPYYPWVCKCGAHGLTSRARTTQCARCRSQRNVRIEPWDGWIEAAERRRFIEDGAEIEKMMREARDEWNRRQK